MSRRTILKLLLGAFALVPIGLSLMAEDAKTPPRSIESKDPKFAELIDTEAKVEELAAGFKWSEGPVWDAKNTQLLFCDIPNNTVFKWSQKDGLKEFLKPSGYTGSEPFTGGEAGSNGLTFNKDGQLVLCQHGDRRVAKLVDGKFVTLADKYLGKRLNSPNDLVYHPNGDLYFTDPPYGLPKQMQDPNKELDFQGVYRLKPNGELTLLTKEMSRPNGIGLSPDSKTLYVANSDPEKANWMMFPVKDDGTLGEGKPLHDTTDLVKANKPGLPDGLKVDQKGNIWATGPGGVFVFDPIGKLLGQIHTNDKTANCGFGDDGSVLYICANHNLVRVKTKVKGLGF
jgi:gluconolactonase